MLHRVGERLADDRATTDGEGNPEVAIAFPDYPRFRVFIDGSEWALRRLNIGVYLVSEDGSVEEVLPHGEE